MWENCAFRTCSEKVFSIHLKISMHNQNLKNKVPELATSLGLKEEPQLSASPATKHDIGTKRTIRAAADVKPRHPYTSPGYHEQLDMMRTTFQQSPFSWEWEQSPSDSTITFKPSYMEFINGEFKCRLCDFATALGFYSMTAHVKKHSVEPFKVFTDPKYFTSAAGTTACIGVCPSQRYENGNAIPEILESHLRRCHMLHCASQSVESCEFQHCPFCAYIQAETGRQHLYEHIHEHGATCRVCASALNAEHMYGCAIRKPDSKRFVICSLSRAMLYEIKVKQFRTGEKNVSKAQVVVPCGNNQLIPTVIDQEEKVPDVAIASKGARTRTSTPFGHGISIIKITSQSPAVSTNASITTCKTTTGTAKKSTTANSLRTITTGVQKSIMGDSKEEEISEDEQSVEGDESGSVEGDESGSEEETATKSPTAQFFSIIDPVKPYQCYFCAFSADEDSAVTDHLITSHVNEQYYTCRLCTRTTSNTHRVFKASRRANWSAHMANVHGICTHILEPGKHVRLIVYRRSVYKQLVVLQIPIVYIYNVHLL